MKRCLFPATLLLLWIVPVALGLPQATDEALPDSPSAALARKKAATRRKPFDIKLLVQRSRVFPDLALTDKPMTAKQKFKLSVNDSLSLAALGGALFSAGFGQARDNLPGYGQGASGFGRRFGAAMGTSASSQFFGTFLLASVFQQDPRFFVRENLGARQSLRYGLRRTVITRSDLGGETPNISGLLGPLAAQGLANAYLPDEERTAARTFQRYGTYLAMRTGVNIAKQYWPTVFKGLMKSRNKSKGRSAEQKADLTEPPFASAAFQQATSGAHTPASAQGASR